MCQSKKRGGTDSVDEVVEVHFLERGGKSCMHVVRVCGSEVWADNFWIMSDSKRS